jgi:hypothetical protein
VRNSVSAAVWAGIIGNLAYEPIKAFLGM